MTPRNMAREFGDPRLSYRDPALAAVRSWYAVYTLPQNERSAVRHLQLREIEAFLPTFETIRVWKNRQRIRTILPLFPTYLFVRINRPERVKVLQSPGVLQIVGNGHESIPVPDAEVDFLRSGFHGNMAEPYRELVIGEKVRIRSGALQGIKGVLVRRKNSLRFVLALDAINQFAAVEVDAHDLEPAAD